MDTITILQLTGFAVCFILLFVFIAKYHGALEDEQDLEDEVANLEQETVAPQAPVFAPRASLLQTTQGPAALEVADLKEQVKTLYYQLEELKTATQKHQADVTAQLARLEGRMGTFEQEYVSKLQPTLLRVIDELEHIKGGEQDMQAQPAKEDEVVPAQEHQLPAQEDAFSGHNSLVPELPEEELKF